MVSILDSEKQWLESLKTTFLFHNPDVVLFTSTEM